MTICKFGRRSLALGYSLVDFLGQEVSRERSVSVPFLRCNVNNAPIEAISGLKGRADCDFFPTPRFFCSTAEGRTNARLKKNAGQEYPTRHFKRESLGLPKQRGLYAASAPTQQAPLSAEPT